MAESEVVIIYNIFNQMWFLDKPMTYRFLFTACILTVATSAYSAKAVDLEWSTIGDNGNMSDSNGFGAVAYDYRISKHEVTNLQYVEFLNAVASIDANELYSTEMADGLHDTGGIIRSGTQGSFSYSARPGRKNHPVVFVNWYDALRFANWMHNGQPIGIQDSTTTEDGAYTFHAKFIVGARSPHAKVFLPNRDEWYKAAYYKSGSSEAGYWEYATSSDILPISVLPPGSDNSANYAFAPGVGGLTNVGAYTGSQTAYGLFDMNGNAFEWTEQQTSSLARSIRGGSWLTNAVTLSSQTVSTNGHLDEQTNVGFRVASIPEPATVTHTLIDDFGCLMRVRSR